jgi:Cu/Ag efflux pump CusA
VRGTDSRGINSPAVRVISAAMKESGVSHVIVLFDLIEEMHEKGEPLERALPDAGIERIRPVMITVGATILALFPLALEGGPLWKPLCYAQIGGLAVATFITLLLVPVFLRHFCARPQVAQMGDDRKRTRGQ